MKILSNFIINYQQCQNARYIIYHAAKMSTLILTSKHSLENLNSHRLESIRNFLSEYQKATLFYIDYLFNNRITYSIGSEKKDPKSKTNNSKRIIKIFDIKNDELNCPLFLSTKDFVPENINLSQRALNAAATQALGIIRACVDKRKRLLFTLSEAKKNKQDTKRIIRKLRKAKVIYPQISSIKAELSTQCFKFENKKNAKHFDCFGVLSSIGKSFGKILIPFNYNSHSKQLGVSGERMTSILLSDKYLYIRWKQDLPKQKTIGEIVGLDQGIKTCLTLSDGQVSKELDDNDLDKITNKIARKKLGSKAFHRAIDHRNNYIGWAVNQLKFSNIKELRIEKISNFRQGKKTSKKLNYFGEKVIMDRIYKKCLVTGVRYVEQNSAYKSQRCSKCGYVHKNNRKGKNFYCLHCSFQADADFNASKNQVGNLLPLERFLGQLDNKDKGFFWKEEGISDLVGQELTVPVTRKDIK